MEFDREKFRELVIYVSHQFADDKSFGDTKLNKALYFIDFFGYSHLGAPVTGAEYFKQPNGPLAKHLIPEREELERLGDVKVEMRPAGPYRRRVTLPTRDADTTMFSEKELELIDDIINQLRGYSATAISDISHTNSPGWRLAQTGETIPYETALIARSPLPERVRERFQALAAKYGW